jgi:Bacterial membrane protein YfhO
LSGSDHGIFLSMSVDRRSEKWRVPVFLAGLTLFFYWKILFTNRAMFPWDAVSFFYPYLSFAHEELRHFRLPLWDPYVLSGHPIIGDPEGQIFYPPTWLLVLLHPISELPYRLVEIQEIVHFFLAGLFMYNLAQSFVQSRAAALFSAVLFQFGGAMVAHTEHVLSIESIAWYPLTFLLARRGLLEGKRFFTISAGFVFGIQTLAGHWQHSAYLGLLLFLYFVYEGCLGSSRAKLWPRCITALLIIGAVGAALAMVQIIPTYELGALSVRRYLTYWDVTGGNEPQFLWTLFLPNFFGGLKGVPKWYPYDLTFQYVFLTVPGCLLALLGLIETVRRRNFFWLGLVLLTIELSLGRNGHLAWWLYHVPILNMFRNPATFFDVTNFALCLMAGVGAKALFEGSLSERFRRYLPVGLTVVLFSAIVLGLVLNFGRIYGWYHMLAVLAAVNLVVTAMTRKRVRPEIAQWTLLGIVVFQLCFYNINQRLNSSANDPRRYVSRNLAFGRARTLEFLRSDRGADFRVGAFADDQWSGNGPNVWRIPSIFGWNPITLLRYEDYIRGFISTSRYTLPYGGRDQNLDSSMLDMLGTKYVVSVDSVLKKKMPLGPSSKFELMLDDVGWWRTYRNKNYLSRTWFYPKAYVLPGPKETIALMSSSWFDGRQALLFEKGDLPPEGARIAEELPTVRLEPGEVAAASQGAAKPDLNCAEPLPMFAGWGAKEGDWLRYNVPPTTRPGRYLLVIEYTAAAQPPPSLEIKFQNSGRVQRSGTINLPGTFTWACRKWRCTDLGAFEIAEGPSELTITSKRSSAIQIYSVWLIRLPSAVPKNPGAFSFDNFFTSANSISFRSHQGVDGYILLNEIHYPGWTASVDGQPTEIIRADSIFRSAFVPAGTHRIEFRFQPRYFAWGAAISILTLIGGLTYAGACWRGKALH